MAKKKPAKKKASPKKTTKKKVAKKPAGSKLKKKPKKKKSSPNLDEAIAIVRSETGKKPTSVLGDRFPLYAFRVDKDEIPENLSALSNAPELDGFLVVGGYYRSSAIFLVARDDQFRFFFADRKVTKWIKQKGDELGLILTSIQIGKFLYEPNQEFLKDEIKQLRSETKAIFGLDNPISVSANRITVRYG